MTDDREFYGPLPDWTAEDEIEALEQQRREWQRNAQAEAESESNRIADEIKLYIKLLDGPADIYIARFDTYTGHTILNVDGRPMINLMPPVYDDLKGH